MGETFSQDTPQSWRDLCYYCLGLGLRLLGVPGGMGGCVPARTCHSDSASPCLGFPSWKMGF